MSAAALLDRALSQLLLVDIQERLAAAVIEPERIVRGAALLVRAAVTLGVPIAVSEQYPKGLGPTVPALAALLPDECRFEKLAFSCLSDERLGARLAAARDGGRRQLVLAGLEAHVCVLQTALEAKARGDEVFVAADAVSSRGSASVDLALRRLEAAGVRLATVEMVVFEWLRRAGSEDFRALSPLLR